MSSKYALMLGCLIPTRLPQIEVACRKVFPLLGVEFDDSFDFSCCPNSPYIKPLDKEAWLTIAARNLSLVEEAGLTITTPCPGCSNTLIEAKHDLDHDKELRARINERLKTVDKEYKGKAKVRHLLQVLVEDVGLNKVKDIVKTPLKLKIASHYGCHLLKPSSVMGFEEPFKAHSLEDLTRVLGGEPVEYENRDLCCGLVLGSTHQEGSLDLAHRKFTSVKAAGGEALIVCCPTCFLQFDTGQMRAAKKFGADYSIPVLYFAQLMGLAAGLSEKDMGLQVHRTKTTVISNALKPQ
jgi:heterodisulfide reductase subunit B2